MPIVDESLLRGGPSKPTSDHNSQHETTVTSGPPGQSPSADDPSRQQPTPQRPQKGREDQAYSKSTNFADSYGQAKASPRPSARGEGEGAKGQQ